MKISYNWLQTYIAEPLPEPMELAEKIIFGAFEVEETETVGNDTVLEIKVLPDRAHDCQSHYGMAREISGLLGLTFINPMSSFPIPASVTTNLNIDIETSLCRRYMGRIIRGITIGSSPDWMKTYLEAIGQRSINNIVDATNIVMYDCGQPTHAFDANKLANEHIIVKTLEQDSSFVTLSDEEKILKSGEMVIADENTILAIAGVKGGKHAEVDEHTTDIVIEVANFDPVAVRKTARRLNILTDSAKRFENELTPERASFAIIQLSALIMEMCPDATFEDIVDVYPHPVEQGHVAFTADYINGRLGTDISLDQMSEILNRYGYEFAEDSGTFTVAIPFERIDITGAHDMIEEIGRAYGYNYVPATLPVLNSHPELNAEFAKICAIKSDLIEKGYHEVMTYSFTKKGTYEVARGAVGKSALRKNLSDGLKDAYELNRLNKEFLEIDDMKLFEVGTVFWLSGEVIRVAYHDKKGVVEETLDRYISQNNLEVSTISYELPESTSNLQNFVAWSDYPYIARDIAVWVPESVSAESISKIIRVNAGELLMKGPRLFDTFTKDGKTSFAFRMVFQSNERTLVEQEITDIMNTITSALQAENWEVR